jgi:hypothetical protein
MKKRTALCRNAFGILATTFDNAGRPQEADFVRRWARIYLENTERMDDGYAITAALEALPIDPAMLKRRKAA